MIYYILDIRQYVLHIILDITYHLLIILDIYIYYIYIYICVNAY